MREWETAEEWESPGKRRVLNENERRRETMTKQHFELIAGVLSQEFELRANGFDRDLVDLAVTFADVLAEQNPRFDRGRFLEAAGALA